MGDVLHDLKVQASLFHAGVEPEPTMQRAIAQLEQAYSFIAACTKRRVHMGQAYERYEVSLTTDDPRNEAYGHAKAHSAQTTKDCVHEWCDIATGGQYCRLCDKRRETEQDCGHE